MSSISDLYRQLKLSATPEKNKLKFELDVLRRENIELQVKGWMLALAKSYTTVGSVSLTALLGLQKDVQRGVIDEITPDTMHWILFFISLSIACASSLIQKWKLDEKLPPLRRKVDMKLREFHNLFVSAPPYDNDAYSDHSKVQLFINTLSKIREYDFSDACFDNVNELIHIKNGESQREVC